MMQRQKHLQPQSIFHYRLWRLPYSIIEGNALQTVPPGPDPNTALIQLLAQIQVANRALLSNIGMPEPNKLDNSVCPFYIA